MNTRVTFNVEVTTAVLRPLHTEDLTNNTKIRNSHRFI